MAMGTVTFRSDMLSPAHEIGYGKGAQKWKMTRVSGSFPKVKYGITSVFMDIDIQKAFGDKRQMLVTNSDGVTIGNLWVGDVGCQRWSLNRSVSYENLSWIITDGGNRPSCVVRGGTYLYIYVNWESVDAEIIDPPSSVPKPVINNSLTKYPTKGEALHTQVAVSFNGVDISEAIEKNLLTLSYTDNEEDEADDLQIKLHDKNKKWLGKWLNDTLLKASYGVTSGSKGMTISAGVRQYRDGKLRTGDFGLFELDSIKASGPPSSIIIKGTSLPFSGIRTEKRSKNWEGYTLKGIGREIAQKGGLGFVYDCPGDPKYSRIEQSDQTDIAFLMQLCHDNGYSLKISGMKLIIFDQNRYENMQAAATIRWLDGTYTKYDLQTQDGETHYDQLNLVYYDASGAVKYTATVRTDDYDEKKSEHTICTVTSRKVHSAAAAGDLAKQLLRLHNKYEKRVTFTLIGNPVLSAGMTVTVEGFGLWDDKYIIKTCKHEIGTSGYVTKITLRTIPEGSVTTVKEEQGEKKAVTSYSSSYNYDGGGGSAGGGYVGTPGGGGGTANTKAVAYSVAAGFVKAANAVASMVTSAASALFSSKPVSSGGTGKGNVVNMLK